MLPDQLEDTSWKTAYLRTLVRGKGSWRTDQLEDKLVRGPGGSWEKGSEPGNPGALPDGGREISERAAPMQHGQAES